LSNYAYRFSKHLAPLTQIVIDKGHSSQFAQQPRLGLVQNKVEELPELWALNFLGRKGDLEAEFGSFEISAFL
jgi:hypothetical protein